MTISKIGNIEYYIIIENICQYLLRLNIVGFDNHENNENNQVNNFPSF